jgi:Domain of unknown function DUF11
MHRANATHAVTMPILVTNHSSIEVRNLLAYVSVPIDALLPFEVSGAGWSCGHLAYGAQAVICTRPSLAAGEVAPLTLTANAPPYDFTFYARVRGEQHSDPVTANDSATATIEVGPRVPEEEGLSRILVPLGGPDVRGSNNSLWRVENTGVILSDAPIEILPQFCTLIECLQPLRTVFDLKDYAIAGENNNGSIIYVRESEASKLRLNSRVYDVSRSEETAGAEIPIVREEELTVSSMSIVGIPIAPHYRHTLRVYDVDAREGAEVEVRLFANGETTPRSSTVHTLAVPPYASPTPPEHPFIPGYLQLELGQLLPLAGISTLRVDVEPVTGGSHLWSFVSVTNNDTHHVTTFSAQ